MAEKTRVLLSQFFPGEQGAADRKEVATTNKWDVKVNRQKVGELRFLLAPSGDNDHEILAIGAVSRDPGRSQTYLDTVQDFQPATGNRATDIPRYWRIYKNDGLVNNAVNKIAALLSSGGEFRVRRAKRRGRGSPMETLLEVYKWWARNVNASALDSVITGSRGLKSVTHQGTRQALVEGSWIAREVWGKVNIPELGTFSLPMNIQSLSIEYVEPVEAVRNTGIELFYWRPNQELLRQLQAPDPDVKKIIKKYVPNDVARKLIQNQRVLLDPALLLHVKHRGTEREAFGESLIQPSIAAIAYRKSVDQLDIVVMENLINRLLILMVGSDDPGSPLFDTDVAQKRVALLQSMFVEPGPNMTIIWAGQDIQVKDVGAHTKVLELDGRHQIGQNKVKEALGAPEALLTGTTDGSKASGWASQLGMTAEMEELQNGFAQAFTTLGERIAIENNFTDVDVIYEFDRSIMLDRVSEVTQSRNDYVVGLSTIFTALRKRGLDPQAEFLRKCDERGLNADTTTWEEAFAPPQGLPGQGLAIGPDQGRPDGEQDRPDDRDLESRRPDEQA